MTVPDPLLIYHIVHMDKLASILDDGHLYCDARIIREGKPGTTIGMASIKTRRLSLPIECRPGLMVGECVPFYFCPRSIMLYLLHRGNHEEITYRGGQDPIIHLECDFHRTVEWAHERGLRWAFTLSNAGARYVETRRDLDALEEVAWSSVRANQWSGAAKEGKQAEFLIEDRFPWSLVDRIGVNTLQTAQAVMHTLQRVGHRPPVEIRRDWYY